MSSILNASSIHVGGVELASGSALTIPVSQLKSYTPSFSSGTGVTGSVNSAYYLSLGIVKYCWGNCTMTTNSTAVAVSGPCSIGMPAGLFSSVHCGQLSVQHFIGGSTPYNVRGNGAGTTAFQFKIYTTTGVNFTSTDNILISWFCIGS